MNIKYNDVLNGFGYEKKVKAFKRLSESFVDEYEDSLYALEDESGIEECPECGHILQGGMCFKCGYCSDCCSENAPESEYAADLDGEGDYGPFEDEFEGEDIDDCLEMYESIERKSKLARPLTYLPKKDKHYSWAKKLLK